MKNALANFIARLSSRKFLLTVAAALTFYANKQYMELAITIVTYLGVEGSSDLVSAYAKQRYTVPATIEQTTQLIQSGDLETETSKNIVPGLVQ
jgi:hypothetical protein